MCSRAILRAFTVENAFFKKPKNSAFGPLFWRVFHNKWSRKCLVGQFWPKIYHWTRFHDNLRPRLVKIFPRSLTSALKSDRKVDFGYCCLRRQNLIYNNTTKGVGLHVRLMIVLPHLSAIHPRLRAPPAILPFPVVLRG